MLYRLKMTLAAATIAAVSAGSVAAPAVAATFGQITLPGGATNDGLLPIYGTPDPRQGWFGATLYLVGGPADIEVTYLGSEAGFNNQFWFGGNLLFSTGGGTNNFSATGLASTVINSVAPGMLSFFFRSPLGDAVNGSNPDPTMGALGPNYFVSFANQLASGGRELILWFDDDGANTDDNHDDMAIRLRIVNGGSITAIPLPAGGLLLIGALGGLALLRRRKTA